MKLPPIFIMWHVGGHCWKSFQGQRSKVKVIFTIVCELYNNTVICILLARGRHQLCTNVWMLQWYVSTVWCRGSLVNILHLLVDAKNSMPWYIFLSQDMGNIITWTVQAAGDWSVGNEKCVLISLTGCDRYRVVVHWATHRPTNQPVVARRWRPAYSVSQWAASFATPKHLSRDDFLISAIPYGRARRPPCIAGRSSSRSTFVDTHPPTRRCQAKATGFASQQHITQTSPQGLSTLASTQ